MRFCTSAGAFELPHVRVLARALAEHHPREPLTVLLTGRSDDIAGEPFTPLSLADLGFLDGRRLVERHDREDMLRLLRPQLLNHLLHADDSPLVFLSPQHEILAPLDPVASMLHDHPVVLAPRTQGPLPEDGEEPTTAQLRAAGRLEEGMVALRPSDEADRFLEWWAERADKLVPYLEGTRGAGVPEQGKRQLRRLLDIAPALHDFVGLIEDPGVEVSRWNLHERPIEDIAPRSVLLDEFRPDQPYLVARSCTRVTPSRSPALRQILDRYAARLIECGWSDLDRRADVGRHLVNGLVFDERLRRLLSQAVESGGELGDVFSPEGTERFLAWLREPARLGAQAGISRYLYQVYRDRADLPEAYPDLDGPDGPEFAAWCWVFGRREMAIPFDFLPPVPGHIDHTALQVSSAGQSSEDGLRKQPSPVTVEVAGYFTGTLGLGEAARLYVRALAAAGVPVHTTTVDAALPIDRRLNRSNRYGNVEFEGHSGSGAHVSLICVNADELPRFSQSVGPEFFGGRRNIGVWAWETDVIPDRWQESFALLDEIWVYSRYIAENLGRAAPIPVVPIPPPVTPPPAGDEPELGLPEGFRFLFMCDLFSTVKRKNPVGVIEAFKRAFAPGEGPHLVIKTIHGDFRRADYEELVHAAADHPDVHLVDCSLPVAEKNGLLASCDCYVSLHRSEGYGLPLAECMAIGKPVIATAFSGNLDFMTPGNSYLVDYTLTQVGGEVEIYPAEGTWAEPDLDHAAAQMRAVFDDEDEARRRGNRAHSDIAAQLSPEHVGAIARARLERLPQQRTLASASSPAAPPAADGAVADLRRQLSFDPGTAAGSAPKRLWRRLVLRAVKPYSATERSIDEAVVRALEQLSERVDELRRDQP